MAFNILMYTILVSDTSKVWKKTCEFILSCLWKDNLHLEEGLNSTLHWLVHQFSMLVTLFCASNAWQEQSKPRKDFWPVTLERFQTSKGMEEGSVSSMAVRDCAARTKGQDYFQKFITSDLLLSARPHLINGPRLSKLPLKWKNEETNHEDEGNTAYLNQGILQMVACRLLVSSMKGREVYRRDIQEDLTSSLTYPFRSTVCLRMALFWLRCSSLQVLESLSPHCLKSKNDCII